MENLISNVQDYQVKTTKFTEEYPDISLAPKKAQIVIDEIVYQVLRAVQPGQRIKPVSHMEIALPEAKDVNTVLENAHGKLKRALMAQIQRCWKPKGNEYTFIDRYTTAECIREALEMNYTHPIFIAQTLIEAVKDTRETSDLWRKIRFEFMPQRSTRIVDKDRKPFHILDLYQLACQQSAGHNTAAQVAAQQFQNHEQRGTDTRTYIANKLDRLHALLALYDQLDDSSPENNFITVAIMTALHNISEKANKPMQTAMKQDKESDSPELPWKRVSDISYDALANRVKAYQAALTKLAKAVDIETERRASFGATNRRNGKDNGIHKFPHSKIGGTQSGKNEHGQGNGTKHPPDTSKPCTHYRCKRRKLPPHNVGQLDECGFLCGLQLQGINCPNKGINDYNGRHLYRDTCRQAWEQQRQDSSTGKRPQRRKSPKNGSDNTPTITNMPAILIKLRSTINKSTKFSPYELMGAKSPILTGTVPELDDTQYDFTTEFGTDQQWENWIKRLQEKRAVALTNDIESRDQRVEEMNSNRPATAFQVGDWVRIAMQNRNKTSAQVSEPYQVIEVPEEGQTYRVQNPRNGRTRPVGITEMTKTTAPTTAQVNTTAAGQHQNIPVALAKISNGDTTTYEVIEYSSNAKAAQKFKQYKNTRPHSQASMAKWVKTSVTISNPKVIDEFHLTWNPTSKTYVIPRVVRQRNRSITAIQGRKAPAQNTGGNP